LGAGAVWLVVWADARLRRCVVRGSIKVGREVAED